MSTARKPVMQDADHRRRDLAQIHIAKGQIGMADDTYRQVLWTIGRVKSAADLDHAGRRKLLDHMRACGFKAKPGKKPHPGKPHNMTSPERGPLLSKVEALLADAGREWAYADSTVRRMFGIERVAFCHEGQLHKLVAALEIDKRRRADKQEVK